MPAKVAKSKRPEAERAAVHAVYRVFGCVAHIRAVRTQWQRQDLHACDVEGVRPDGNRVWVQVTAGQTAAVLTRRKKLERERWGGTDRVFVWQLVDRESVRKPGRKDWFFRVWEYAFRKTGFVRNGIEDFVGPRRWVENMDPIPVPPEWFKAYRPDEGTEGGAT